MAEIKYTPNVGDVIRSRDFIKGTLMRDRGIVYMNRPPELTVVNLDLLADDATRATANFVVVEIKREYVEREKRLFQYVMARRLTTSGKYNPKGELISFALTETINLERIGALTLYFLDKDDLLKLKG